MSFESIDWEDGNELDHPKTSTDLLVQEDRLTEMLRLQEDLQRRFLQGRAPVELDVDEKLEFIRNHTLAQLDEIHEALRETGWKPWSRSNEIRRSRYVDEIVDEFHFFMNRMLIVGMTAEELFSEYLRKNKINHERQDSGYVSPTG